MIRTLPTDPFLFGLAMALLTCVAGCGRTSRTEASTPGWTLHTLAAGLQLEAPGAWRLTEEGAGRIRLEGSAGEQMVIWPMTVAQPELSPAAAQALVGQFARAASPQLAWTVSALSAPGYVRAVAQGGAREGVTLMMWRRAEGATGACVFSMHTAAGGYARAADTFAKIVTSFRAGAGTAASAGRPTAPAPAATEFRRWADPHEDAFSTAVPAGWRVVGGAYRLSATDVRPALTVVSPDGAVRISVGDANIGGFTMPTQMHAMMGMREGTSTSLGDGTILQILRFIPGQAFVRQYVEHNLAAICGGPVQVVSSRERGDLAATFLAQARGEGIAAPHLTAGEVAFTCQINGRQVTGYYAAATMVPLPNAGPLWYAYRLYGYLAPEERQQEAGEICQKILASWQVSPAWREKERQIATAAVYQDNLRSQQVRSRALQAIAEDLRQTSDMISSSYWQRQQVYDEISRRRENAILGTVDVLDPATGRQYKVGYNADHHWTDAQGNIVGTLTHTSPGVGWRELIDLK